MSAHRISISGFTLAPLISSIRAQTGGSPVAVKIKRSGEEYIVTALVPSTKPPSGDNWRAKTTIGVVDGVDDKTPGLFDRYEAKVKA